MFFLYEFAIHHLILLMLVFLVQTTLRAFVCGNFFTKALIIIDRQAWIKSFLVVYYGSILSVIVMILLFSVTLGRETINCTDTIFSKIRIFVHIGFDRLSVVHYWFPRFDSIVAHPTLSYIHCQVHETANVGARSEPRNFEQRNEECALYAILDQMASHLLSLFCPLRFHNDGCGQLPFPRGWRFLVYERYRFDRY
jgi:hypothetical protein